MQAERKQPTGVTILGVLSIIGGILSIILGSGMALFGSIVSQFSESDMSDILEDKDLSNLNSTDVRTSLNEIQNLSGSFFILGIFLAPLGIADIIIGWALLRGKRWAWIGTVILTIISVIFNVVAIILTGIPVDAVTIGVDIAGFTLAGIILWYLYRPNVKSYFGRVKSQ